MLNQAILKTGNSTPVSQYLKKKREAGHTLVFIFEAVNETFNRALNSHYDVRF